MDTPDPNQYLGEVSLLTDDARRRLYQFVAGQDEAVTRDQAATATGISRTLAAYHLDKLAEAGLVQVSFARAPGRAGPGAGRPAKRYGRSSREIAVSFPPRSYSLLARMLATAADASPSGQFQAALATAAEQEGRALGEKATAIPDALTAAGYDPVTSMGGDIILRNCPFHSVVHEHTELVCTLNEAFIQGALEGVGADPRRAELSPCTGRCCVVIHPEPPLRLLEDVEDHGEASG